MILSDDEISLPADNNDNLEDLNQFVDLDSSSLLDPDSVYIQYRVPQLPTVELEEPSNEGLEFEDNIRDNNRNINNNFDQEADFLSDYMTLLSGMYLCNIIINQLRPEVRPFQYLRYILIDIISLA